MPTNKLNSALPLGENALYLYINKKQQRNNPMEQVYVENGQSYNGRPIREGECPHCGSDDLETDDQGLDDNTYYYDMQCNSCSGEWTDIYLVQFSSMYIKPKEKDNDTE